jgi:hypothetical protein
MSSSQLHSPLIPVPSRTSANRILCIGHLTDVLIRCHFTCLYVTKWLGSRRKDSAQGFVAISVGIDLLINGDRNLPTKGKTLVFKYMIPPWEAQKSG